MTRLITATLILGVLLPLCFGSTASVQGTTGKSPTKELFFRPVRSTEIPGEYSLTRQRHPAKTPRRSPSRIRTGESDEYAKPSPLLLVVRVTEDRKIFLNSDELGTLDDSSELISRLLKLFSVRKDQRAYKIGMELRVDLPESERIEKQVYFQPQPTLKEDEVSKLLQEIKETGAAPVITMSKEEYEQQFGWLFEPEKYGWSPPRFKRLPGGRKIIEGGILNGKALSFPKPSYPASARAARLSGTVVVQVTIDETGKVISARAVSGPALLRTAAVDAARQATFPPKLLVGEPVSVRGVIHYTFVGS